jgi:hypothetical protein
MSVLVEGGGDRGNYLEISCVPDATLESEIDTLITAGTDVIGKLVTFTFSNNYEVTSAANSSIPDGKIVRYEKRGTTYQLTCRIWHYTDQNAGNKTPNCIVNLYSGGNTVALRDSILTSNGTTFMTIKDGTSGGWGAIIGKNTPAASYNDVII